MTTPRAQGFAMPPEWALHERCWMAWPCRPELWGDRFPGARRAFAEVARAIAQFEPVTMLARPELIAEASLHCGKGVSVLPMAYDDCWTRDTAPSFVRSEAGELAGVSWRFNGFGERSPHYADDARLAGAICERLQIPSFPAPMVLEGGNIHVDGEGTGLVCAAGVLDPKRNPELGREQVAEVLRDHLGTGKVIWLEQGLVGDPTGGHVDNLACFVRPGVVLALSSGDPEDANHAILQDNVARLQGERDAAGRELEVIEIEQPAARHREDGRRICASYINFYLANGAVIVPTFDDPMDEPAYRAIAAAFPNRDALQIDAGDLVHAGGGIHCITQQQPARRPASG